MIIAECAAHDEAVSELRRHRTRYKVSKSVGKETKNTNCHDNQEPRLVAEEPVSAPRIFYVCPRDHAGNYVVTVAGLEPHHDQPFRELICYEDREHNA